MTNEDMLARSFAVYNNSTGKILRTGCCRKRDLVLQAGDGETAVEVSPDITDSLHRIVDGEIANRPELPQPDKTTISADGQDTATISGLPNCAAEINGVLYAVTDGTIEIVADEPGTYRIEIRHFPYIDYSIEIVAQ